MQQGTAVVNEHARHGRRCSARDLLAIPEHQLHRRVPERLHHSRQQQLFRSVKNIAQSRHRFPCRRPVTGSAADRHVRCVALPLPHAFAPSSLIVPLLARTGAAVSEQNGLLFLASTIVQKLKRFTG